MPRVRRSLLIHTRGYAGGLDGRRSQRRIVNIKRVRSNAKSRRSLLIHIWEILERENADKFFPISRVRRNDARRQPGNYGRAWRFTPAG